MKPWKPKLVKRSPEKQAPAVEPVLTNDQSVDSVATAPSPRQEQAIAWAADQQLSFFVLASLTALAVYLSYIIFRPFLIPLFVALILTIACFPLHRWIKRRIRNPSAAALATTILAVLLILVPSILVSIRVSVEAVNVYRSVLQPLGNKSTWPAHFASLWDPLIQKVAEQTGVSADQLKDSISTFVRKLGTWLFGFATSLGQGLVQQIATTGLTFMLLFFFLRDSNEFGRDALSMLPLSPNRLRELWACINQGILANIYGMLTVAVAEGILTGFGLWVTGLRSPLLWGAIAMVLSCLPVIGISLVWVPGCALLALRGYWVRAILLFLWGLTLSTVEGIVRSNVVSGRVRANSLIITLSFMGGLATFGAVGLFVGPVVVALVAALLRILREEHANLQESRNQAA